LFYQLCSDIFFCFWVLAKPQINTKALVSYLAIASGVGIFSLLFSILVVIIHHAVSVIFHLEGCATMISS
jgi:hypothetical protein